MKKQFLWMLILSLLCVWMVAGADEPANQANLDEQQKLALEKEMQAAREADQAIREAKLAIEQEAMARSKVSEDRLMLEEEKKKATEDPEADRPEVVIPYEPPLVLEVGDDCTEPIVITIDDVDVDLPYTDIGQTTCGRGNTYSETCLGYYDGGEDIIYQITNNTGSSIWVNLTLDADDIWGGIAIDDACPLDPSTCLAKAASSADPDVILNFELENGVDYYIMCDIWPTPNCMNFDLTIEEYVVPTGACCYGDPGAPDCIHDVTEDECYTTYSGYDWTEGVLCDSEPNPCPPILQGDVCEYPLLITLDVNNEYTDTRDLCQFNDDYRISGADVIYEFTPDADLHLVVETCNSPEEFDDYLVLYYEADCGTYTQILTEDYGCASGDHGKFDYEFLSGQTYNLMIDHWEISEPYCGTYTLDIYPYVEPTGRCCDNTDPQNPICTVEIEADCSEPNDVWTEGLDCETPCPIPIDCSNPIQVTLPPTLLTWPYVDADQTTCGKGHSYDEDTCLEPSYDNGEDILYEITVTEEVTVNIYLTSNTTWTGMAIGTSCPPGPGCLALSKSSGTDESIEILTLPAGTYYLMIDTYSSPDCIDNYTLTIDEYIEPTGACCLQDDQCLDGLTREECQAYEGARYMGDDTVCAEIDCTAEVPTLSEWGMIIFTLLLLSLGTVAVIRRRKAISAKEVARG